MCFVFLNYVFAIALNSKLKRLLYQNSHLPRRKVTSSLSPPIRPLKSTKSTVRLPKWTLQSRYYFSNMPNAVPPSKLYNQLVGYEGILGLGGLCRRMNTVQMFRCPDPTDFCYVSHLMEFSLPWYASQVRWQQSQHQESFKYADLRPTYGSLFVSQEQ